MWYHHFMLCYSFISGLSDIALVLAPLDEKNNVSPIEVQASISDIVHIADYLAHMVAISPDLKESIVFPTGCFSKETQSLAKNYGIGWCPETAKTYGTKLKLLISNQTDVLEVFWN